MNRPAAAVALAGMVVTAAWLRRLRHTWPVDLVIQLPSPDDTQTPYPPPWYARYASRPRPAPRWEERERQIDAKRAKRGLPPLFSPEHGNST